VIAKVVWLREGDSKCRGIWSGFWVMKGVC